MKIAAVLIMFVIVFVLVYLQHYIGVDLFARFRELPAYPALGENIQSRNYTITRISERADGRITYDAIPGF